MAFRKGNKLGAPKIKNYDLDDAPICFKGKKGQKEALKSIEGWQDMVRDYVDALISSKSF